MNRYLLTIGLFLFYQLCDAQKADTIIITKAYTCYYSFELKDPIMVVYNLYHGGGDCKREGFSFKTGELKHRSATAKDYKGSSYDKGHLANAEDFAFDCTLEESTFRYWNCYPQTPTLNRGIWKTLETQIRKQSQHDSLLILCGGFYDDRKQIGDGVAIPTSCWKLVYSHTKHLILESATYTNTDSPVRSDISLEELKRILLTKYGIELQNWLH